ncbi:hypothetical protein BT63DRAFT_439199 [Microthyrium microscopicum]|uniref:Micro-fibrillar-associated protein 1 C-terminal domain-containing protein n=1 Tax=Microthyrium microscopicum TaxID=703497 RepID=A0A6A6UF12_9PEZI|nr:hypothetical protein BT63DRAFT_439199 [Microthyrium microscopicum]
MAPKRMTANPLRPARHRPGKPGTAAQQSSSSESESETEEPQQEAPKPASKPSAASFPKSTSQIAGSLKKVDINASAAAQKSLDDRKKLEEEFETESEGSDEESGSGSGSEEESSEEESSSEEETKRKLLRPVFIKKGARNAVTNGAKEETKSEDQKWAEDEAKRKARTDDMIQEQLQRNAQARAEGKAFWDDEKVDDEVDDTDDIDPEAELTAWKLRELKRVKRERDGLIAAEKEREEIERRRNLTAEEREAEDKEHLDKQKQEREGKGKMSYMQQYFHKGAFYTEDSKEAGLLDRDIMGGRYEDDVKDRSALPEYMQIRNTALLGRKGRTKYKDMRHEDTGRFGDERDRRPRRGGDDRGGGGDYRDLDARFQPDFDGPNSGGTGANASALGDRKRPGEDTRRPEKRMRTD